MEQELGINVSFAYVTSKTTKKNISCKVIAWWVFGSYCSIHRRLCRVKNMLAVYLKYLDLCFLCSVLYIVVCTFLLAIVFVCPSNYDFWLPLWYLQNFSFLRFPDIYTWSVFFNGLFEHDQYNHSSKALDNILDWLIDFLCFNATFNNISAISWRPVLVVEEAGVPGENHRPWASSW